MKSTNNMNQQNKTERWVEEFDTKFPNFRSRTYPKLEYFHSEVNATQIKLFISQLLLNARREGYESGFIDNRGGFENELRELNKLLDDVEKIKEDARREEREKIIRHIGLLKRNSPNPLKIDIVHNKAEFNKMRSNKMFNEAINFVVGELEAISAISNKK